MLTCETFQVPLLVEIELNSKGGFQLPRKCQVRTNVNLIGFT